MRDYFPPFLIFLKLENISKRTSKIIAFGNKSEVQGLECK
jgi:hypothetical protein